MRKGRALLLDTLLADLEVPVPHGNGLLDVVRLFPRAPRDAWLEIGFGAGEHLAGQAMLHPRIGFIGCEPFVDGIAGLLARIRYNDIANIRVFPDDARLLLPALPEASIGRVFLLFSDPWPKKRHHKRRFVCTESLEALARILEDGAEFWFASDHMGYVRWTLERVCGHPAFHWPARSRRDWRERPEGWIETRYEAKALARGARCAYLRFLRRPRP